MTEDPETLAKQWISDLRTRGFEPRFEGNRVALPQPAWRSLSPDAMTVWREHREVIRRLLRAESEAVPAATSAVPEPPTGANVGGSDRDPAPAPGRSERREEEPVVYAYRGRPITEADLIQTVAGLGDDALDDYYSGRMPRATAYAMARARLRQIRELMSIGETKWQLK